MLFNRGEAAIKMQVDFSSLGLSTVSSYKVRDVVNKQDVGTATKSWGAEVPRHSVAFVVLTPS